MLIAKEFGLHRERPTCLVERKAHDGKGIRVFIRVILLLNIECEIKKLN